MSKRASWVLVFLFCGFIAVFFLLNIFLPNREFSEQENRVLASAPTFTLDSLASGKFTSDFETYTTDQFAFRDQWITLKAASELMVGKKENNDVYYCGDDTLIEGYTAPDQAQVDTNIAALESLVESTDIPVYLQLVPTAAAIWADKLPENAPNDDMKAVIDYIYENTSATPVDTYGALEAHKDEYVYYRTDHHWTTLGAWYGYSSLMNAMGLEATPLEDYSPQVVTEEFYGTTYSSSGFSWVKPDSMSIYVPDDGTVKVTNYPQGSPVEGTLYDMSYLERKDKYSMFFGGNTPMLEIETGNTDAPSLLIIRDSYADSQTPFLLEHFSHIYVLDLRYYRASLQDFLSEHDIDNILLCYGANNFASDTNVFLLSR